MSQSSNPWTVPPELTNKDCRTLLDVARDSISHGLCQGRRMPIASSAYAHVLQMLCATFVTLKIDGKLRGCIGSLEAMRPLVVDVAEHAYAAAFHDQRFLAVSMAECELLDIQISLLSRLEPMDFTSEQDLMAQLRPGIDGLILERGRHRSTFLPVVWQQLTDPRSFLEHLKIKAGLPVDDWSQVKAWCYTTRSIP